MYGTRNLYLTRSYVKPLGSFGMGLIPVLFHCGSRRAGFPGWFLRGNGYEISRETSATAHNDFREGGPYNCADIRLYYETGPEERI